MFAPQSEIKYLAIKELLSLVIPNSIDALKYNTIEKEAGDDSLQKIGLVTAILRSRSQRSRKGSKNNVRVSGVSRIIFSSTISSFKNFSPQQSLLINVMPLASCYCFKFPLTCRNTQLNKPINNLIGPEF